MPTCYTFWYKNRTIINTEAPVSIRPNALTSSTVIGINQHPGWLVVLTHTSLGRSESDDKVQVCLLGLLPLSLDQDWEWIPCVESVLVSIEGLVLAP